MKTMSLMEHLMEAARHLKEASRLAVDWRVRDAAAGAGTIVGCGIHVQKKIAAKELKSEEWRGEREEGKANTERPTPNFQLRSDGGDHKGHVTTGRGVPELR